jgi:hypothetical protein
MDIFYEEGVASAVALTSTAALLTAEVDHSVRHGCVIQNLGAGIAYLGFDSTVTTSNGIELPVDSKVSIDGPVAIWGVSASTSDIRVWELK